MWRASFIASLARKEEGETWIPDAARRSGARANPAGAGEALRERGGGLTCVMSGRQRGRFAVFAGIKAFLALRLC